MLFFIVWRALIIDPPIELYPDPEILQKAESYVALGRSLMSDEPELYRLTWSFLLEPPCPDALTLTGSVAGGQSVPCTTVPALPVRPPFAMPAVLYTAYQCLTYTAPQPPDGVKASLQLSWRFTLASAGVVWELTATAAGLQHDVLFCEYQKYRRTIYLTPLTPLKVEMLRPKRYHHLSLRAEGFALQTHEIRQWRLPLAALAHLLLFDVLPSQPKCGVPSFRYTTKPARALQSVLQGLIPDAAAPSSGDRQVVVTPMLGFRDCGEFPYAPFLEFMTHRAPASPSNRADGPPLELWRFTAARDLGEDTRRVLDPLAAVDHRQVRKVRDALTALGLSGPFAADPAVRAALDRQALAEETRYASGADAVRAVDSLLELHAANPANPLLADLVRGLVLPRLDQPEAAGFTEIEFNPFHHCGRSGPDSRDSPFLGRHFWDRPPPFCPSCAHHDRILVEPYRSFSHSRLLAVNWRWTRLHAGDADLYRKAHGFIREVLVRHGRDNLADVQAGHSRRQAATAHQGQRDPLDLAALEAEPSAATPNRARANRRDAVPQIFREPYDRCMDPSWTAQYLALFGEIGPLLAGPCGLLWAVRF